MNSSDTVAMAQVLRRFVARAPRYTLRPNDNQILRYAHNNRFNRSYSTRFLNISETGLAFAVDRFSAPSMGEVIKVEFSVPGGQPIAWFAQVVRLEVLDSHPWWQETRSGFIHQEILVGARFHDLPEGHLHTIRLHLQQKFRQILRERNLAKWNKILQWIKDHGWQLVIYMMAIIMTITILYILSKPSATYDSKRGAPWGHRF